MQPPSSRTPLIDQGAARALSALAHGAIVFGFLGLGFIASLAISGVIWLYGRRSPEVRFHSEQAGCYQCSVLLINVLFVVILGTLGGLSFFSAARGQSDWGASWGFLVGLLLFLVWFVVSLVSGLIAAAMVLAGRPFQYPVIGDRFRRETDS